ncbi:MAG TPA: hypothetical protein VL200_07355 [Lacunisphaera sp.]|jgi:hypothetical protein|nr:hypothetical protein [Lacunisphaera sp.]
MTVIAGRRAAAPGRRRFCRVFPGRRFSWGRHEARRARFAFSSGARAPILAVLRQEYFRAVMTAANFPHSPRENLPRRRNFSRKTARKTDAGIVDTKVDRKFSRYHFNLFDGVFGDSH